MTTEKDFEYPSDLWQTINLAYTDDAPQVEINLFTDDVTGDKYLAICKLGKYDECVAHYKLVES